MRLATFNIKRGLRSDGVVDNQGLILRLHLSTEPTCLPSRKSIATCLGRPTSTKRKRSRGRVGSRTYSRRRCNLALGGLYGNALLARGTIDHVEVLRLPVASHRQARNCVLARVALGDASVSVAATHLQNRRGGAPRVLDEAKEQVEQLRVVLGALEARPAPRALLGDLNAPPAVVEPLLGEMGLRLTSTDPTAPAHRAVVQLDHIAVDGLHVISSETILTAVSDHLAVVVEAMPVEVDGL